jgi:hypothetical protein
VDFATGAVSPVPAAKVRVPRTYIPEATSTASGTGAIRTDNGNSNQLLTIRVPTSRRALMTRVQRRRGPLFPDPARVASPSFRAGPETLALATVAGALSPPWPS